MRAFITERERSRGRLDLAPYSFQVNKKMIMKRNDICIEIYIHVCVCVYHEYRSKFDGNESYNLTDLKCKDATDMCPHNGPEAMYFSGKEAPESRYR